MTVSQFCVQFTVSLQVLKHGAIMVHAKCTIHVSLLPHVCVAGMLGVLSRLRQVPNLHLVEASHVQ